MNRLPRRLLAFGTAVALLAACGGGAPDAGSTDGGSGGAAPGDVRPLEVAADGFLLGSQAWVARDQGYFADNGIEANVQLYGTGIEAIEAVIGGQADVAAGLDFAVLNAASDNLSVVGSIAAPEPGFHKLAVNADVEGPEDLTDATFGFVDGTSEAYVTALYIERNGLDGAEMVPLPGLFELVNAMKTGDIDASWVWANGVEQVEADDSLKVLTNDADVLEVGGIYLIARTDFAQENQDLLADTLTAYEQASEFIASDTEAAAGIIAEGISGEADTVAGILPGQNFRVEFPQVQLDAMDSIASWLIDEGTLPDDFDIREFLALDPMEQAVPGSVGADLGS